MVTPFRVELLILIHIRTELVKITSLTPRFILRKNSGQGVAHKRRIKSCRKLEEFSNLPVNTACLEKKRIVKLDHFVNAAFHH